jgi:hypothetical protein
LCDVILDHGNDQLVLALEIRIKRPRVKPAAAAVFFDAGAADSRSSKTRAAASNSFSQVSSRVGLVRTLDILLF